MAVCAEIKRTGGRCTVSVEPGQTYCHHHDPARSEERRRAASRAGKSKPTREFRDIEALCQDLTERVLAGDLLPGPAAVANQLINTRLRAIEQERRNKESEDLEVRIEALEREQAKEKGPRKWRGA